MTVYRVAAALAILVIALAGWLVLGQYTRAASLLVLAADLDGRARLLVRLHERAVTDETVEIPLRDGSLRARVFLPEGPLHQTVVLVTGVHPAGIDEPRLIHFARSFARVGVAVVTPELRGLIGFEIAPDATDAIEDVAAWAAQEATLGAHGRVGLAGISFSGGLAVVAAGRPALRDRTAFVLSLGGHGDLMRTLETLGGDALTDAGTTADVFGLAIVLTAVAQHVVPDTQVAPLREWGRTYLQAAHLPLDARAQRQELFARADRLATGLGEPAATFVRHVRQGDAGALRPHLLPVVRRLAADPALSPERSPPPAAAVYLLHGTEDDVIPPEEAEHLATYLRPQTRVRLLLTPVLTHADVMDGLSAAEGWAIVRFFASVLRR